MISELPIETERFNLIVANAVSSVFQTMLSQHIELDNTSTHDANGSPVHHVPITDSGQQLIVGNIGFVGKLTGMVYIYMTYSFATKIASEMLGMEPEEVEEDEMVNDVIGELSNMIVGHFKNQLDEHGYGCRLTIPSILRGSNFEVEPVRSASRQVYYFSTPDNQHLIFDLLMQPGD